MRASPFLMLGGVVLAVAACAAPTAIAPPAGSGYTGAWFDNQREPQKQKMAAQKTAVKRTEAPMARKDKDAVHADKSRDREVHSRERTVYRTYDSEAAYRRATLQGDTYHGDGDVPHPHDDGGDPFHDEGGGGTRYQ